MNATEQEEQRQRSMARASDVLGPRMPGVASTHITRGSGLDDDDDRDAKTQCIH